MGRVVEAVLGLAGMPAYLLVGALAFGESAAFLGLFVPGELAVVLGGVVVSQGGASLPTMIVVASVAAVAGDSVGYEVGRRFGPRLVAWQPFERRFGHEVERASRYLQQRGGPAVFLGRWTSVLRALVPGLAGMSRMPYGRFLAFDVTGGVAWATTFVVAGYLAGASWRRIEQFAGRASLVLLLMVLLGVAIRWATKTMLVRADAVRRRLLAFADLRPVAAVARRFRRQLAWLAARFTPGTARGLGWTLSVLAVGGAAWLFGGVAQDLFAHEEIALLDTPVAAWFAAHRSDTADSIARGLATALGPVWGWWLVAVAAGVARALRVRTAVIHVVLAAAMTAGLTAALHAGLPTIDGVRFPAAASAFTTATVTALLPAVATRGWRPAIRSAGVGTTLIVTAALAELVTGRAALSGVVGGIAFGILLAVLIEFTTRALTYPGAGSEAP